jgi:NADH-quinone oxidoreductase subunit H
MTLSVLPVFLWINAPGRDATLGLARVVEFQSQPGFLGRHVVHLPDAALGLHLPDRALRRDQPPALRHAESEADLVGGFHTEYGAFKWGLFFVAEYAHMIVGSACSRCSSSAAGIRCRGCRSRPGRDCRRLGWRHLPLAVGLLSIGIFLGKVLALIFFFMWVRWTVPRFRYDQVMKIGWQKLLPLAIANLDLLRDRDRAHQRS